MASCKVPAASAWTRASASVFAPAMKFSNVGWGGCEISSGSCCMLSALVKRTCDVRGAQVAQAHEQRGACRQRKQHAEKAEHLAEGEQREYHRDRVQADPVADDQRRDRH